MTILETKQTAARTLSLSGRVPLSLHGSPSERQRIDSTRLLRGGRELLIAHAGQEYRLRLTRNDKLILTK